MKRQILAPIKEGRHLRWTVDRRNKMSDILSVPGLSTVIVRRAMDTSLVSDLMDPFGFQMVMQKMQTRNK